MKRRNIVLVCALVPCITLLFMVFAHIRIISDSTKESSSGSSVPEGAVSSNEANSGGDIDTDSSQSENGNSGADLVGSPSSDSGDASNSSQSGSGSSTLNQGDHTSSTVILDSDIVIVKMIAHSTDALGNPGYRLEVTNRSNQTIAVVAASDFYVNGSASDCWCYIELKPGATEEVFMYFFGSVIGNNADVLVNVEGTLEIYNESTKLVIKTHRIHID